MSAIIPAPRLQEILPPLLAVIQAENTRRAYSSALSRFLAYCEAGQHPFSRVTVHKYRRTLEDGGLSPRSINLALSAIRALAREAHALGLLDENTAIGITQVVGIKHRPDHGR